MVQTNPRTDWLTNPNHPIWMFLSQLVVCLPLIIHLAVSYKNGWSDQDWITVTTVATSLGVFEYLKNFATKPKG